MDGFLQQFFPEIKDDVKQGSTVSESEKPNIYHSFSQSVTKYLIQRYASCCLAAAQNFIA